MLRQVRLDANDDDPIWRLFVALQWHLKLYEDIPRQIHQTALRTLEDTTAAVEAAVRETESTILAALAAKVAGTAEKLAGRKALKAVLIAATIAIAVFALALGGSWLWLERLVRQDYAQRYEQWFNQELRKVAEQEQVDPNWCGGAALHGPDPRPGFYPTSALCGATSRRDALAPVRARPRLTAGGGRLQRTLQAGPSSTVSVPGTRRTKVAGER